MAELKLTNNHCKFCNGEIDEGKPLCGDIVDEGDVVNIVKTQDGYEIELWRNFEQKAFQLFGIFVHCSSSGGIGSGCHASISAVL